MAPLPGKTIILKRILLELQQTKCPSRSYPLPIFLLSKDGVPPLLPSLSPPPPLLLKFVPVILAPLSLIQGFLCPSHSSKTPFGVSPLWIWHHFGLWLFSFPCSQAGPKRKPPPEVLMTPYCQTSLLQTKSTNQILLISLSVSYNSPLT